MAESLLELKKKISSTQKTGQITEAMRMVSGVHLNQTEKLDEHYSVYHDKVRATVSHLMSGKISEFLDVGNGDTSNLSSLSYGDIFDLGSMTDLIQPRK